jgi:hypothetical protein
LGALALLVLATGVAGNLDRLGRTDPIFLSNPELRAAEGAGPRVCEPADGT